jgi:hypothetical protein
MPLCRYAAILRFLSLRIGILLQYDICATGILLSRCMINFNLWRSISGMRFSIDAISRHFNVIRSIHVFFWHLIFIRSMHSELFRLEDYSQETQISLANVIFFVLSGQTSHPAPKTGLDSAIQFHSSTSCTYLISEQLLNLGT